MQRTAIADAIESRGFNRSLSSYVRVFDGEQPDAALLLLERYGYKAPADPRMLGNYRYVQRELGRNGLLYRYRTGAGGLPPGEGAFGLACFWAADYLARLGRTEEAAEHFEQLSP